MKFFLLALLTFFFSQFTYSQIKVDSLFYLDGRVEVVNIQKNTSETIDCNYIGEDLLTTINKSLLHKIVFKSGRVELCNNLKEVPIDTIYLTNGDKVIGEVVKVGDNTIDYTLPGEKFLTTTKKAIVNRIVFSSGRTEVFNKPLNIKIVMSDDQWEDVVVTYNIEDTKGLVKVTDLEEISLKDNKNYDEIIKILKIDAADNGCGLVLIRSLPNAQQLNSRKKIRILATGYKVKDLTIDEILELYRSGEMKKYDMYRQEKFADVLERYLKEKFERAENKEDIDKTTKQMSIMKKYIKTYNPQPGWSERTLKRLEKAKTDAETRVSNPKSKKTKTKKSSK